MTHNIIQTDNYLLVVDDSEIKEGDFFMTDDNRIELSAPDWRAREWHKKIIAHLPLNGSPILEGVDLLPPLEDEVAKLAEEYTKSTPDNDPVRIFAFIKGYNKAKEKYKYTEEDIKEAMLKYGEWIMSNLSSKEYIKDSNNQTVYEHIIQSLQQSKMPVEFECEMIDFEVDMGLGEECIEYNQYPKTTTNSQGLTQWGGKYIH